MLYDWGYPFMNLSHLDQKKGYDIYIYISAYKVEYRIFTVHTSYGKMS